MNDIEFRLRGDSIDLNQLLKAAGVCDSGGAGKALVAAGRVKVDGKPESRKTCTIRAGQTVTVDGMRIRVLAEDGKAESGARTPKARAPGPRTPGPRTPKDRTPEARAPEARAPRARVPGARKK